MCKKAKVPFAMVRSANSSELLPFCSQVCYNNWGFFMKPCAVCSKRCVPAFTIEPPAGFGEARSFCSKRCYQKFERTRTPGSSLEEGRRSQLSAAALSAASSARGSAGPDEYHVNHGTNPPSQPLTGRSQAPSVTSSTASRRTGTGKSRTDRPQTSASSSVASTTAATTELHKMTSYSMWQKYNGAYVHDKKGKPGLSTQQANFPERQVVSAHPEHHRTKNDINEYFEHYVKSKAMLTNHHAKPSQAGK